MKPKCTIRTNGARVGVTEKGTGELTLILLHCWGGSARTWERVIARFGESVHSIALTGLQNVTIPVRIVVGGLDQVEHESALREGSLVVACRRQPSGC